MILMIDNYDSFTYNLVQYIEMMGVEVKVRRNDAITVEMVKDLNPEGIVISRDRAALPEPASRFQSLLHTAGNCPYWEYASVTRPSRKLSRHHHQGRKADARKDISDQQRWENHLFRHCQPLRCDEIPPPLSWRGQRCLNVLEISAESDDGEIMGLRHRELCGGRDPVPSGVDYDSCRKKDSEEFPLDDEERAQMTITGMRSDMIKEAIKKAVARHDIDEDMMYDVMTEIMSGDATDSQIGAFIGALSTKGETFAELAGAARAMRRKAIRINTTAAMVVDTCGTGGDGSHTFNISTTAAFVVAGCGGHSGKAWEPPQYPAFAAAPICSRPAASGSMCSLRS